jgi:metal-responsive CopG/Arc/MetJ family transcriptional regulator
MATINFSVPDEVKREFQETFAHENKSAVITRLMKQAVEERKHQQTRAAAIEALLKLRTEQRPASDEEIRRARHVGRP